MAVKKSTSRKVSQDRTYKANPFTVTVNEDSHGKYVITRGFIYRPIFPKEYSEAFEDGTNLQVGEKVQVNVNHDGPLASVRSSKSESEVWFSHGERGWKPTDYLNW